MIMLSTAGLARIPVTDVPYGELVGYVSQASDRARALRDDCLSWLPNSTQMMLPVIDAATRAWLRRSRSPYVAEVEAIAAALNYPGIWFLNGCYQWGCTSLARDEDGAPWLARTLDWPFPGLGRHIEIARMRGVAGPFDNVTWPGYVGTLTASAPERFAAAINQAPLWRRTRHPWLRPYDIAANALNTWRVRFTPPDHLLREVFETCRSFAEARRRLETTPIARPVIYTMAGCERGERCVIERTEESFVTHAQETGASNDWLERKAPWEARISSEFLLTRSYEEAAENSRTRRAQLAAWPGKFGRGSFDWVAPPVLNPFTRIAVEMCPARATLRAVGYELAPGGELPQPVTLTCELAAAAA
jgi:hypothetical protein